MSKLKELAGVGQAVWLDFIRRSFLEAGELQKLVGQGLRGVTSNPSIFKKAIADSNDYDKDLYALAEAGKSTMEIYEALAIEDIRRAADDLRPVYDETGGKDGFVSLEVNPDLAHETEETVNQARRLYETVDRPNLMIKVPATPAGIPAIRRLIGAGININVTLIFSLESYRQVAEAFIAGLEVLAKKGPDVKNGHGVDRVASVASFFVSRVDGATDKALQAAGNKDLQGKIAIANAKLAYRDYQKTFSGDRWARLAAKGAVAQRVLWASTSTKNPDYPDTLYVDELIGEHTVNTLPPNTLESFVDHGKVALTLDKGVAEAESQIAQLAAIGVDFDEITQKLQDDGVKSFADAFGDLINSIDEKKNVVKAGDLTILTNLGKAGAGAEKRLKSLTQADVYQRLWKHDHTIWKDDPKEITNRLGWLHSPEVMLKAVPEIEALVKEVRDAGYTHALLLGMGGSSLAPEVFRLSFGVKNGYLDLAVLDSTDPTTVLDRHNRADVAKTLFIVSTKSGGTVETLSFAKYFYRQVVAERGVEKAGENFVAITDPGSKLEKLAHELKFRKTFLNDPDIGGRYSALSYFGLVPAALVGVEIGELLNRAAIMAADAGKGGAVKINQSTSAILGTAIGELATIGKDKLTLILPPQIAAFGDWVEQLVAESTGKEGKGILPVVGESFDEVKKFGDDRLFVAIKLAGDQTNDQALSRLADAGHPLVVLSWKDLYDIGGEFLRWEIATVVASIPLQINPFDQPNVESAKVVARDMVAAYHESGNLPELPDAQTVDGVTVYGGRSGIGGLDDILPAFLANAAKGGQPRPYVALHAYLHPAAEMDQALQKLRDAISEKYRLAVTIGYGPRFLHSTGQLHKGDAGNGLFIQFLADVPEEVAIPDEPGSDASAMNFGVLKEAQALGDRQALLNEGREVLRLDLGKDSVGKIIALSESVSK